MTNTVIGNGVGPGYTLSASPWSTGSNVTWTTSNAYTIAAPSVSGSTIGAEGKISLMGENADINLNGKSMRAWMEKVEAKLNILSVNTELEAEWQELRELGDQYRALEQRIKDKAETWRKLNATDSDNR